MLKPIEKWALFALTVAFYATNSAAPVLAQVIAPIGAEFTQWETVFTTNFVPFLIFAGCLLAVALFALVSPRAGMITGAFVVVGALWYGLRTAITGLAA